MNLLPTCFLYSQDAGVRQMVDGYLMFMAVVRHVEDPAELESLARQFRPALLIVDLRGDGARQLLPRLLQDGCQGIVIALGTPHSDPVLEAEALGVHAIEGFSPERQRFQSLIRSAQVHQRILQENLLLRSAVSAEGKELSRKPDAARVRESASSFRQLSKTFRHFGNVDNMIDGMVEEIACCARVSRVGIFLAKEKNDAFRFSGGMKCLPQVREGVVESGDPLINWMRFNAHVVSRSELGCIGDLEEKLLLKNSLDWLGAEAIVPLHGRERVIGFLFVGRGISGNPFGPENVEELTFLADHLSIAIEHSLLYEKTVSQESLMNTVFDSMPAGIITMGASHALSLINNSSRMIFDIPLNLPFKYAAMRIDNRVKDLLSRCIAGETIPAPGEWTDPVTKRSVSVLVKRLEKDGVCEGAAAIIHDATAERRLREHEGNMERAAFWASLAAAISHEVRNPLVAISTFAQLLPERYDEPEFRAKFTDLVAGEVGRLNAMVKQLDAFASPVAPVFRKAALREILDAAMERARKQMPGKKVRIDLHMDEGVPMIECSTSALIESFHHIILNAIEATDGEQGTVIAVKVSRINANREDEQVLVQFTDNGRGISREIVGDLFSPFVTTKIRGLGLGLPIARRTVSDHHGEIEIHAEDHGTCVTVKLPVTIPERKNDREAHPGN